MKTPTFVAFACLFVWGCEEETPVKETPTLTQAERLKEHLDRINAIRNTKPVGAPVAPAFHPPVIIRKEKHGDEMVLETEPVSAAPLTRAGIIRATNAQRSKMGLPALTENGRLNTTAAIKVADMFRQQYFAHPSPQGILAKDLFTKNGYDYSVAGENLAAGVYSGDEHVVWSWMESPGHRAAILENRFTEIGVAAREGTFQGKKMWFAVQHFGRPASIPVLNLNLLRRGQ